MTLDTTRTFDYRIGKLSREALLLPAETTVQEVKELLDKRGTFGAIVIGRPAKVEGLVIAHHLHRQLSHSYGISLFYQKGIGKLMDQSPLLVQQDDLIEKVAQLAMNRPIDHIYDDVVILDGSQFVGVASVWEILDFIAGYHVEGLKKARKEEAHMLEITTALSSELKLTSLLTKIMDTAKNILDADRCTLFLHDEKTNELWSQVAQGLQIKEIRFPSHLGIAGSVFSTGETVNIPDAYADSRFNPEVDKKTGYRTNNILCMPLTNKEGVTIGATQVLNKLDGPFTAQDERRLSAFSAQMSVALENAKLFEEVLNVKNYNESILESMNDGVMTLDTKLRIVKCNQSVERILQINQERLTNMTASELFERLNPWVLESLDKVREANLPDNVVDKEMKLSDEEGVAVNLSVVPLKNVQLELIGYLLVFEDITQEKRLKSTMVRYMTQEVADKLLESGDAALGGQMQEASVLFSDIRKFTTISEKIGAQETVQMLNEYFSVMVDIVFQYKGILDKYIGDAMLAVFGVPFDTGADPDNSVIASIDMIRALRELNKQRVAEKQDAISIGIGICTDSILAGNIGSIKRMDYTVIGDGVNLASRLEGATKFYGSDILISEKTRSKLRKDYLTREVDRIKVKGKTRPVGIHQVLDYHDQFTFPHLDEVVERFNEGVRHYRNRDFKQGIHLFRRALELNPEDRPSQIFLERCQHFDTSEPEEDWDGIWTMTSK